MSQQNKYIRRVIKQVNTFWKTQEEGYISWEMVADDFDKGVAKGQMLAKYGFTTFQYKILKEYMVGK
jgi:hypothetical protein